LNGELEEWDRFPESDMRSSEVERESEDVSEAKGGRRRGRRLWNERFGFPSSLRIS